MDISQALVNLMKAADKWSDEDSISAAMEDAVKALGYDPTLVAQMYSVSVILDVEATSPQEAVEAYIYETTKSGRKKWVYTVKDEGGAETDIWK